MAIAVVCVSFEWMKVNTSRQHRRHVIGRTRWEDGLVKQLIEKRVQEHPYLVDY